jgi:hypothetical protein
MEVSLEMQLAQPDAVNDLFYEAINALVDLLSLTPKLQYLFYQGGGFRNADPFMPALSTAISRPLPLVRFVLCRVMVLATNLLDVLNALAPTLKHIMLVSIDLDGAAWHFIFDCMATSLQLNYVHLLGLSSGNDVAPTVCFADIERKRPIAYGSELRDHSDAWEDFQEMLQTIGPELDDGYVWVFQGNDRSKGFVIDRIDQLDDVGYWLGVIRDQHRMIWGGNYGEHTLHCLLERTPKVERSPRGAPS